MPDQYLTPEQIAARIDARLDVPRTEVADRLDVSRAAVSNALNHPSRKWIALLRRMGALVDIDVDTGEHFRTTIRDAT